MGGAGPYVKFTPKVNLRKSCGETIKSVEEAYERAKPFIVRWKQELLSEHNYQEEELPSSHDSDRSLLIAVSNPTRYSCRPRRHFKLPSDAHAFACDASTWEHVFTSLHAKRPDSRGRDLFLDEDPPLQNIFYLLQTILDGMLSIVRENEIDEYGEETITRVLPRKEWIQLNSDILKGILGLPSTDELEEDAEKHGILYEFQSYGVGDSYSDADEDLDYTACDLECGYCGKCDY